MDAQAVAGEVLGALSEGRQIEPFSARLERFDTAAAYAVTARLLELRLARGEQPVGRKIGFTNRGIWQEYGVYQPIWGHIYDSTVRVVAPGDACDTSHLPEPRIEPEIVLGVDADLEPGMTTADIAQAVGWVAHGFEIVQSIYPDWRFTAADCIADNGLHGALLIGPKRAIPSGDRAALAERLAAVGLTLFRNGELIDKGVGANALDGPVEALRHLVGAIAENSPIRAGEMVTTGTLTRAFSVISGETWSTEIEGFDLPGLSLTVR
ncbi:MAG: hydratase [Rhizobiaceae bacterium]|nr:hydratase [Rhizobiaceae bacterium]